jgi:hypothetical protein
MPLSLAVVFIPHKSPYLRFPFSEKAIHYKAHSINSISLIHHSYWSNCYFHYLLFFNCAEWGYTVACTKVLTIYQVYHTWIHPLHHSFLSPPSSVPGIVSTGLIFSFAYMCTPYLCYIHSPTPFPHIFPLPLVPNPQDRTGSTSYFSSICFLLLSEC